MADEKKKTLDDILKRISADERRRSRVTAENVKVSKKVFNVISVYPQPEENNTSGGVSAVIMSLIKKVSI